MGNMIRNRVMKPFRHFNVESRAERVISKDKPIPAPKYQSNKDDMERVLKQNPNILEEISRKDPHLYDRLKDVYVSSNDIIEPPNPIRSNPNRPLPLNKDVVKSFEYGVQEPETITPGLTTLRLALKFITEHNINPQIADVKFISKTYNLKPEVTENVLHYFKTFEIFIPPHMQNNPLFAKAIDEYTALKLETAKQLNEIESNKSNISKEEKVFSENKT